MVGFTTEQDCLNCEKQIAGAATLARHNGFMSYDVNINGVNKGLGAKRVMEYLVYSLPSVV